MATWDSPKLDWQQQPLGSSVVHVADGVMKLADCTKRIEASHPEELANQMHQR
jgi:hypothetical protein